MNMKNFIKQRRLDLGLTMADVAKAVGVSEATVSRWESGNIGDMKRGRIKELSKVLQLNPLVLAGWGEGNTDVSNEGLLQDPTAFLTPHEKALIMAYREKSEMQPAVDTLLGISHASTSSSQLNDSSAAAVYVAAYGGGVSQQESPATEEEFGSLLNGIDWEE